MDRFDTHNIRVAMGLSGGVDSSVGALLLKEAGFNVTGIYLKCYWTHVGCASDRDRVSAARAASFLDIPFEVWDFEKEYKKAVIDYSYREYQAGRTPNPDVACNREIKFGLFLKEALRRKFDFIATGHYAGTGFKSQIPNTKFQTSLITPFFYHRSGEGDMVGAKLIIEPKYFELIKRRQDGGSNSDTYYTGPSIFGGVDGKKDQSYFLYDISKRAVEYTLYPLFGLLKSEVRQIAKTYKLPAAERPDSQGICFLGEVNVEKFLKERIKEHAGEVTDTKGRIIGEHKGIEFYTIGQRHGFKIFAARASANTFSGNRQSLSLLDSEDKCQALPARSSRSGALTTSLGGTVRAFLKGLASAAKAGARRTFKASPSGLRGGEESTYTGPLYVIDKDIGRNRLIVGVGEECKTDRFSVKTDRNFQFPIFNFQTKPKGQLLVRIRHLGQMVPCVVESGKAALKDAATRSSDDKKKSLSDRSLVARHAPDLNDYLGVDSGVTARRTFKSAPSTLEIKLDYPVFGVAPGQSAVFYRRVENSRSASQNGRCLRREIDRRSAKLRRPAADYHFDSCTANSQSLTTDAVWEVVGGGVIE